MMKYISLLFLSLSIYIGQAQNRLQTRTAQINFEGSVESFEPIEATNKSATVVLDTSNGAIASLVLMKGFTFPIALMQEHFNENYIESDDHPKAILRGNLQDFDIATLSDHKNHSFNFTGTLTLHGVEKEVSFPILLEQKDDEINLKAQFGLLPKDYDIKIPSIVAKKIAQEIKVSVEATLAGK